MELIEYKEMREAIMRIRQIHRPITNKWEKSKRCSVCWNTNKGILDPESYPCPTIQALDNESTIKERLNRIDQAIPVKLEEL